ncbi:hypothetical protein SAMN06264364_13645 [Quadrisphaera granulorum]|uniref:Uncharacterized protein n=1 Tax=Quadrisphaera granulorum TaxID=317664 RepID=A0A315ZR71_9ACTN|nr:hypothetical protein BXY45_13645 [Quadrisphaera granulorum]SZE98743.1 hypothetical protein SAMN06264364_13645 [Quadrisphaera granulorum]
MSTVGIILLTAGSFLLLVGLLLVLGVGARNAGVDVRLRRRFLVAALSMGVVLAGVGALLL